MKNLTAWKAVGKKIRGASHIRADKPCQDAIILQVLDDAVILAVADGHGSERSPYSDEGAQIAVKVASDILQRLYIDLNKHAGRVKRFAEEKLAQDIVWTWTKQVKERHKLKSAGQELSDADLVKYGSTLIAVLASTKFILLCQLGDGDVLVVDKDGKVFRPIPRDKRLLANATTSLCTPKAWLEMEVKFYPLAGGLPALILVSTDGYANSFISDSDFLRIGPDYLQCIQEFGLGEITCCLEEWLTEASFEGSGDDITLGILCRSDVEMISLKRQESLEADPSGLMGGQGDGGV